MTRSILECLLVDGLDDWNYAGWVAGLIMEDDSLSMSQIQARALSAIAEALFRGLVEPGDVDEAGFTPWGVTPAAAFERICGAWLDKWIAEVPPPGAIVWLNNTVLGDEMAHRALGGDQ